MYSMLYNDYCRLYVCRSTHVCYLCLLSTCILWIVGQAGHDIQYPVDRRTSRGGMMRYNV